jgi:hypothetical protein
VTQTVTVHRVFSTLRTRRGMNDREHPMARHKRVQLEKDHIAWELAQHERTHGKPAIPCTVLLMRCGPTNGLDDDNLVSSLKSVRDAVAKWLGVDDRDRQRVRYRYAQRRQVHWGVCIEFGPPVAGSQFELEV